MFILTLSVIRLRRGAINYEVGVHGNKSGKLMMGRTGSSNINIRETYWGKLLESFHLGDNEEIGG